jgi:hypothetical protein
VNRAIEAIPKYVADDAVVGAVKRQRSPKLHIVVQNSASNGITPTEFAANQTVSVPPRKGAAARAFQLVRIVTQSGAWVTYELN